MNSLLTLKTPGTSRFQFYKLTALGIFQCSLWLPLSLAFTISNVVQSHFLLYRGWDLVHKHFNAVDLIDPKLIPSEQLVLLELSRWMGPLTAVCLFLFFGTKKDVWINSRNTCKQTIDFISDTVETFLSKFLRSNKSPVDGTSEKPATSVMQRVVDLESQVIVSDSVSKIPEDSETNSVSLSSVYTINESLNKEQIQK